MGYIGLGISAGVTVALLAASPAAALQAKKAPGWSAEHLKAAQNTVEAVRDVGSWIGDKPPPVSDLAYQETRGFDMQLHQSLKARLSPVSVKVDGAFARDEVPPRMGQWLRSVEKSGGAVQTCVVDDGGKSFLALLGLLLGAVKKADKWMLYRPARRYDAILIVDPNESDVMNVVFNERGTVSSCPRGTTAYRS